MVEFGNNNNNNNNVVRSTGNKCTGKHLLFWKYTGNVLEFQK